MGGIQLNKKIFFFICLLIIFILIFFIKNLINFLNVGNNNDSQEIVNSILNINSYEATIEMEVQSNKNTNKYIIKQSYIDAKNNSQEILEPENIKGVKIEYKDNKLTLSNSRLNLVKIFDDYKYLAENVADLYSFINDYKNNADSNYYKENSYIVMETKTYNRNIYLNNKKLYVNQKTNKPYKMIINSDNKKEAIYILYNEVSFK